MLRLRERFLRVFIVNDNPTIKLIAGLGNPGKEYEKTRHNIGFMFLEELARSWKGDSWNEKDSLETCKASFGDSKFVLAKPLSYMNLSGKPLKKHMSFFKVKPSELLVVHDEIDLKFGKLQLRLGGGVAGNNGLKSIVSELGSKDFYRLRVGVGKPSDYTNTESNKRFMDVSDWVLSKFDRDEEQEIENIFSKSLKCFETMFTEGFKKAQTFSNSK